MSEQAQSEKKHETPRENSSPSQMLALLPPSVPLTPSETASLRKEMSAAMEWMDQELAKS